MNDTLLQWLYTAADNYDFLHYCEAVENWGFIDATGSIWETAACGLKAEFNAPGLLSRLGRPRCPACCAAIGIKAGNGCPANERET